MQFFVACLENYAKYALSFDLFNNYLHLHFHCCSACHILWQWTLHQQEKKTLARSS